MISDDDVKLLAKYYYTPSLPSAYGASSNLKKTLTSSGNKRIAKVSGKWLTGQDAYTLHKPVINKFPRRQTIVAGVGEQLQADLVDIKGHMAKNDNYKYILTVIDVFSKKAWALPLKSKSGADVAPALREILVQSSPKTLQTDKGKEFYNSQVSRVLDQLGITLFSSENENIKASVVERFNRTLRNTLHRHFTKSGSPRFVHILQDVVDAYNNRFHTSIKMTPNEVEGENQEDVQLTIYNAEAAFTRKEPILKLKDYVRTSKARTPFKRGYTPNWSDEVYTIKKILQTTPVTYEIIDWNGTNIDGSYYHHELQKIQQPVVFKIEEILARKKIGRRNMVLVKWMGYPSEFNEWIPASDVENVSDLI